MKTRDSRSGASQAAGGFSLLELLIALGVVAILLVLTLVVTNGVRERAADATCLSRLRHLVVAIRTFQAEHNGCLPPVRLDGTGVTPDNNWTHRVYPYLAIPEGTEAEITAAKAKLLSCPAESTRAEWNPPSRFWHTHYGVNGSGERTFHHDGRLQRPNVETLSQTMMLVETLGVRGIRARPGSIASIAFRHKNMANVAYFDGHIEKKNREQIPPTGGDPFWLEW